MPEKLLNIEEVAGYLQLNPATVRKLARSGDIAGAVIAGSWRFEKADIEDFVAKQKEAAAAKAAGRKTN